jgi:cytochrome c-type biogenesis protein CcmH
MTLFWIICALLLVVASLFIVLPLWRSTVKNKQVLRDAANLEVFRDQVAEMDTDLRNGLLTPELYEQGKRELQARLLEEVKDDLAGTAGSPVTRYPHKVLALVLVLLLLPLFTLSLYWKLGNPNALVPQEIQASGSSKMDLDAAVKVLEGKVAQNPKDVDSLFLLGRAYAAMERYPDAVKVYEQLTTLLPKEAQLWVDYADVLTMQNGRELAGRPTEMINKALKLDPKNPKALAMAGTAAMMTGEYPDAIRHWEALMKVLPAGSEEAQMVEKGIQEAHKRMGMGGGAVAMQAAPEAPAQAVSPGHERITGTVTLSDELKGKAKPDDLLFVLARAAEGPKMPLAVMRMHVKDLPLQFTLDDSMAMSPQMKLSNFDKVVVVARVSTSGDPMPHPGDLEGMSSTLKPGSTGVKLNIGAIVK